MQTIGCDLAYCNEIQPEGYPMMKAGGIVYAWSKLTQGTRVQDDHFLAHWNGCGKAGILRGAYHMYEPLSSAGAQLDVIKRYYPYAEADLPLALDVEIDLQYTNAYLIGEVYRLIGLLENEYGRRPIIYTGKWWWDPNMTPSKSWMKQYDYWCAQYPYASGRVDLTWGALKSILPVGWTKPVIGGNTPVIWQFSGDKFFFPGVGGALDLNLFNGSEADFRMWAGLTPPEPDWEHSVDPFLRTLGYTGREP